MSASDSPASWNDLNTPESKRARVTTSNFKLIASLLIASAMVAPLPFALAQDDADSQQKQAQTDDSGQGKATEESEEKQAEAKPDDAEQRRGRNDTFVPSEEISDDLSVSFPVDI